MEKRLKRDSLSFANGRTMFRAADLETYGLSSTKVRELVESQQLERVSRGLYRVSGSKLTEFHSLVEASMLQAKGIVCLLSALQFHRIGTQLPHQVWLSIPHGTWISTKSGQQIRAVIMRSPSYESGVDIHHLEGLDVPIYNVPKSIADCFKFRTTVGIDVAVEALRECLFDQRATPAEIYQYAQLNRTANVMRPYLEAMTR